MINKRLIVGTWPGRRFVAQNVAFQWVSLVANICLISVVCRMLGSIFEHSASTGDFVLTAGAALAAIAVRALCTTNAAKASFRAAQSVKQRLRPLIYEKLLRLGPSYREHALTSEVVQVSVEGVDQLETYFGSYLPQLFYALLAPLTLFVVLAPVSLVAAVILLVCVPLIPISIAAVQTWAKRLLSQYWGSYTALGDTFLENLQGLTTLKISAADEMKQREMNERAEEFRRITMRVLVMQLNSIAIMDIVAYGGAAAGIAVSLFQFQAGAIDLAGCLIIMLLAADYFLPMRQLGSFFHIAMNGMAASDKIFRLLDAEEPAVGSLPFPTRSDIRISGLGFAYQGDDAARKAVLTNVNLAIPEGSFTAIVGESGCGKSTLASVLMGRNRTYTGSITIGDTELSELNPSALMRQVTYVGHQSYLFRGTVRENLLEAKPSATDEELWRALETTRLAGYLHSEQGLETRLTEQASNLSGGQRQRLALARALLHDARVYIFDEAASNVDVESEDAIMAAIEGLARSRADKTVIVISHRLANVTGADQIAVLSHGSVKETGTHAELVARKGVYAALWTAQQELENLGCEEATR